MQSLEFRRHLGLLAFALLCALPVLALLPNVVFGFSADPLPILSGLGRIVRGGIFPGYPWIDPNAGTTTQALGGLAVRDWLAGSIPWWNPFIGVGMPLAGAAEPSALFLPFVLLLKVGNGISALKCALQMLSGVATYTLLRQMGLARLAALLGGMLFAFNGTFAWFADAPIMPIAFLPLLLLGIQWAHAAALASRSGGWAMIAIAMAYSLYSGFPETAFIDGLLALAFAVQRTTILPRAHRARFVRKVVLGGSAGLLLAVPLLVPLGEYLALNQPGLHDGIASHGLPAAALATQLMPFVYGPIFAFGAADPSGIINATWRNIGGYIDLALVFLAVLGAAGRGQQRGLRWLMAAWMAVMLARTFALPGITQVLAAVPIVNLTAMQRYASPSVCLAAAVLAAFALDEWQRGKLAVRHVRRWGLACAMLAVGALAIGAPEIRPLLDGTLNHVGLVGGSIAWAAVALGAVVVMLHRPPTPARRSALAAMLVANAVGLFWLPALSGPRRTSLDLAPMAYLRDHLGLQRVFSTGPLAPNFGASFDIAQINHNTIPVPAEWIGYIHRTLDPGVHPPNFLGNWPGPLAERNAALRDHIVGFESAGVGYVIVPAGQDPFSVWATPSITASGKQPRPLDVDGEFNGETEPTQVHAGGIAAVRVTIGTYGGRATGPLEVSLCGRSGCAVGRAPTDTAVDNAGLTILLSAPLRVAEHEPLRYTLRRTGGSGPLAVWLWRDAAGGWRSDLSLGTAAQAAAPQRVFANATADIYQLPHPAPYFEAACTLTTLNREQVHTVCDLPSHLIRRELFYPGWAATVNGAPAALARAGEIFQSVAVPAGESDVIFHYQPSHIAWAWLAASLGALATGWGLWRGRPRAPLRRRDLGV